MTKFENKIMTVNTVDEFVIKAIQKYKEKNLLSDMIFWAEAIRLTREAERLRLLKMKEYAKWLGKKPFLISKHANSKIHDYCEDCVAIGKEQEIEEERLQTKKEIEKLINGNSGYCNDKADVAYEKGYDTALEDLKKRLGEKK